jgi:hypothetical protein
MSMKHSTDTIGNRTHSLLTRRKVAQPAALLRAPFSLLHCVCISFSNTCQKNSGCGRDSVRSGHGIGRVSYHQPIVCFLINTLRQTASSIQPPVQWICWVKLLQHNFSSTFLHLHGVVRRHTGSEVHSNYFDSLWTSNFSNTARLGAVLESICTLLQKMHTLFSD